MSLSLERVLIPAPRPTRGQAHVLYGYSDLATGAFRLLYPIDKSVVIRDLNNSANSDMYAEHSYPVTVARYTPNGDFIASADQSGKLRVWVAAPKTGHVLKYEYQPAGGQVRDLAFTADGQRLSIVGDFKSKFGVPIMLDTGTTVGEITGHARPINSCDFRPVRPFRLVTGGDDGLSCFFEGPPFKFKKQNQTHGQSFVNGARFSPSGEYFATGASDCHLFLYKGESGEMIGEFGSPAHKGGIYSISWSGDSKHLASFSGDKTIKIWNVPDRTLYVEIAFGNAVDFQQLGGTWLGKTIVSVDLSGAINLIDTTRLPPGAAEPQRIELANAPIRSLRGHNKPLSAVTVTKLGADTHLVTSGNDNRLCLWDKNMESAEFLVQTGAAHAIPINRLHSLGQLLIASSMDGLTASSLTSRELVASAKDLLAGLEVRSSAIWQAPGGQIGIAIVHPKKLAILTIKSNSGQEAPAEATQLGALSFQPVLEQLFVNFEGGPIHVLGSSPSGSAHIAVGSSSANKVIVYELNYGGDSSAPLNGSNVKEVATFTTPDGTTVTDLRFSPTGSHLAVTNSQRRVEVYTVSNYQAMRELQWSFSSARVNCVAWSPAGDQLAVGSLDTSLIVYAFSSPQLPYAQQRPAHPLGSVTGVEFLDAGRILSIGADCSARIWAVKPK